MKEKLTAAKGAASALVTALAAILGWKGILAGLWVAAMALDYLSGTAAACKGGDWASAKAREGLWHKGGMLLVVLVAALTDVAVAMAAANLGIGGDWSGLVLPLVLAWYIITELGSVLENAVKLGAKVPGWLVRLLRSGQQALENAGEKTAGSRETENQT